MPSSAHSCATVVSTQVVSHDQASIVVEAGGWQPMQWFLRHGPKKAHDDADRQPIKRRRLNAPVAQELIPLTKAVVDIHFRETLQEKALSFEPIQSDAIFDDAEEVPVNLVSFEVDDAVTSLSLALVGKKGPIIKMELTHLDNPSSEAMESILFRLKSIWKGPASGARCTLSLSEGQLYRIVRLQAETTWSDSKSAFMHGVPKGFVNVYPDYDLLIQHFPDLERESTNNNLPWQPSDFYDSVYTPPKSEMVADSAIDMPDADLYPFQKRAVKWMLSREGIHRSQNSAEDKDIRLWKKVEDANDSTCYVNFLTGVISRQPVDELVLPSGGLLAEEMGLGKTIEVIALVQSHKRLAPEIGDGAQRGTSFGYMLHDSASGSQACASRATLIITPSSILQQWRSELSRHAPHLSVFHYERVPVSKAGPNDKDIVHELCNKFDVVLTTYQTLTRELHFATDPPERNMRRARVYERKTSPLVQIQWWRICLDEAQMVESGVSAAAQVACRLPRIHSWAVTGTPLRKDARDLHGLLIFLRLKPLSDNFGLWDHLIKNHKHIFRKLFGRIALRHTKAHIRDELQLPSQKRVVLTMPFTAIEQQQYQARLDEMCEDIGLQPDGTPVAEWDPEDSATIEAMRAWLMRLRQTCLHPQVGSRNRKTLGRGQGPLRTVAEVLESMIERVETSMKQEERALIASRLLHGHIIGNNRSDESRAVKALVLYKEAMELSQKLVVESRERLRANEISEEMLANESDTDSEDNSDESARRASALRIALRSALEVHHTCSFFVATALYQVKSNEELTQVDSARFKELDGEEAQLYDTAKAIRREILSQSARKSEVLMHKMQGLESEGKLTKLPEIQDLDELGGIENRRIVERCDELFDVIRKQASIIIEWRTSMADLLLKPLVDEENMETTGEEYETSTKEQDTLYVYFDAMKAMTADLNTFITGESAPLIDHEARELTKSARRALDPEKDEFAGECHDPETTLKLFSIRQSFRSRKDEIGSVRGLIQEARQLEGSSTLATSGGRAGAELAIVQMHIQALNRIFTNYTKALQGLEKEIDLYRATQNQRLQFYKELQEISDAVAPYREELDDDIDVQALNIATAKEEKTETALRTLKKRHIYLLNLRKEEATHKTGEPQRCIICTDTFVNGVLISCGHQYCKECIHHWWKSHRTCPMCKEKLTLADFTDITYKPQESKVQEEMSQSLTSPHTSTGAPESPQQQGGAIYSSVDTKLLEEVNSIDLASSYGTKIDTLSRHLFWIRQHDPGAKSIVFSQFREFLDVLGSAFNNFKIGYTRLGRVGAVEKFRRDPSIDCLLLDAKTDSSGLTLVNATHVFICEPLIQTAVELQAIARVHRIGQTRPTTVWMYLISDTVEESIYQISVARRLAHVRSRQTSKSRSTTPTPGVQESAIEAANSEELQGAPISKLLSAGRSGGEQVAKDDLWRCLFGNHRGTAEAQPSEAARLEVDRELRAEAVMNRLVT
ncbi:hypothetical protein K431DRAFT_280968 [Polychaeton citri CBS 116435]|uniref:RING-type domain-containing protein n=1 Tax=Polychaeton citri CBS 116435 TaxID=1314669 RepID=A0A9P4UT15_9PEZI|nr:hypothetical protein K431DRAFT_280968 [Polychaeton citri CBS 116435]